MGLQLVTSPDYEPITLSEFKLHARITDSSQDDVLATCLLTARAYVENRLQQQLMNATWRWTLDRFPNSTDNPRPYHN